MTGLEKGVGSAGDGAGDSAAQADMNRAQIKMNAEVSLWILLCFIVSPFLNLLITQTLISISV